MFKVNIIQILVILIFILTAAFVHLYFVKSGSISSVTHNAGKNKKLARREYSNLFCGFA